MSYEPFRAAWYEALTKAGPVSIATATVLLNILA